MNSDIKLAFFTNPQRETAVNGLQGAVKMAKSLGCKCYISNELKDSGLDGAEEIGDITPDFVLAFGGDGTILRAAGEAMKYNAPILGVNFGRIGFLSEIDPSGLEDGLNRLIRGEYTLDERTMLNCTVNGGEPHYFLNDVLLYKRTFSGVAEISIDVDGLSAGSVICDGVIASTSTGSTGYSISVNDWHPCNRKKSRDSVLARKPDRHLPSGYQLYPPAFPISSARKAPYGDLMMSMTFLTYILPKHYCTPCNSNYTWYASTTPNPCK